MRSLRVWFAGFAPVLLVACGSQTGKVSLLLTDSSSNISAAVVTISEIDLVGSGGTTVLSRAKVTTDLLSLANDTAGLVKDAVVPSGHYSQLRFVITGGYVQVAQPGGGSVIYASSPSYEGLPQGAVVGGALQMPSYSESGLKVDLPGGGVNVGTDSTVLLVDFDVGQSFGQDAGSSGSWVMHPVMMATELELSGTVQVTLKLGTGVTLPGSTTLAQFNAVLTNSAGSPKTLPLTDAGGGTFSATFAYLIPGTYTLDFSATSGVTSFTTVPAVPATVNVSSGTPTTAAFVVTSAQ